MAQISDELAVQITSSLRLAQRDLANQDVILQGTGDVTITMPDNSTRVGPGWAGISNRLSDAMSKSSNLADIPNKEAARTNLGVNQNNLLANPGGGIVRLFSIADSGLIIITRRLAYPAPANSITAWSYDWVDDGGPTFSAIPGISVVGDGGYSAGWRVRIEALTPRVVAGFIYNDSSNNTNVFIDVMAIGVRK